jgi:hypothetical protein
MTPTPTPPAAIPQKVLSTLPKFVTVIDGHTMLVGYGAMNRPAQVTLSGASVDMEVANGRMIAGFQANVVPQGGIYKNFTRTYRALIGYYPSVELDSPEGSDAALDNIESVVRGHLGMDDGHERE